MTEDVVFVGGPSDGELRAVEAITPRMLLWCSPPLGVYDDPAAVAEDAFLTGVYEADYCDGGWARDDQGRMILRWRGWETGQAPPSS